jgi:hypothetical protein
MFTVSYPYSPPGRFDWSNVGLRRVSDGTMVSGFVDPTALPPIGAGPVVGAFVLYERLVPEEDYDFLQPFCSGALEPQRITRYHAVAPIAEPTVLGTIEVSHIYAANAVRGVANRVYFVVVTLAPDPATAVDPWATSMKWTPVEVVDGAESWFLSLDGFNPLDSVGLGSAQRIRVSCDPPGFGSAWIRSGPHTLRGTTGYDGVVRLSTPDIATVIDSCDLALRVDNDTLAPLTPEQITFWDTE